MKRILSYDLGTSGVKAALYDENGGLISSEYAKYPTYYPDDDMREQSPRQWWGCICDATKAITARCGGENIAAIGVSGHSLGVVAVDSAGRLLADKTPIWSDARASAQADKFFGKTDYRKWYEETGNGFPRHLYAVFKQMWYKENMPGLYGQTAHFLGSKDYINLMLTGVAATDRSYASGSGVYSLKTEKYSEEYIECAGIDGEKLPKVAGSADVIGELTKVAADILGLKAGIPVVAGGVDNACMTLGANCYREGDGYASLGSSAWVTVCTRTPQVNFDAMTYTFAHCVEGQYLPSAGIFASGSALEWVIKNLLPTEETAGSNVYEYLSSLVKSAPAGANGLVFVPNLAGGSSFDPSPDVRGMLAGLDLKHTTADVVRAVYEGVAMHLRCAYDALAAGGTQNRLLLVGGGAKSSEWRDIYASVFNMPMLKTAVAQNTASLGAAALAAVGTGVWKDYLPLGTAHGEGTLSVPCEKDAEVYKKLIVKYKAICKLTGDIAEIMKR